MLHHTKLTIVVSGLGLFILLLMHLTTLILKLIHALFYSLE